MEYVDYVYNIVKENSDGMDAIYEDWIEHCVGFYGLEALLKHNRLESCGVVNGRQLYALCEK